MFNDLNQDGQYQVGTESPLAGAVLRLDETGATYTTGAGGFYYFDLGTPGVYHLTETDPSGYISLPNSPNTRTVDLNGCGRQYVDFGDVRQTYGLTVSNLFQGATTTASSYFTPYAYTGGPVSPALNTPYVASFSTTTEVGGTAQPALAQTSTTTYSVESVTVLAGTFPACKIKVEVTGGATTGNVSYAWLVASGRYKGLFLRSANANGVKTSEATRLLLNGQ